MEVLIDNRQTRYEISVDTVKRKAQVILNALDCPEGELSVLLVDDQDITDLNQEYLNRQGPTNVIAFPMQEGEFSHISPNLLGDVVISTDTCSRECRESEINFETRLDQLLIHGILHLFGYDHENNESEAAVMEKKSEEMMTVISSMTS